MNEQELDRILADIAAAEPQPAELAAAQERVWRALATSNLCAQFRAQFEEYRNGTLSEPKRLLLADHLGRCADCRRTYSQAVDPQRVIAMPGRATRWTVPRWAIAAGIAVAAFYVGRDRIDALLAPGGPRATVYAASGPLYGLSAGKMLAGTTLANGQVIRTGAGAHAVLHLADGSAVEMNESTQLSLDTRWSGAAIHLDRGDVVVQAASPLRVVTRDSVASVRGTVFTVSTGLAGSLVGVMEGSVKVQQPGVDKLLTPGESSASNPALQKISVRDSVAWSQLIGEIASIGKQIAPAPARTQPKLLAALPPDVVLYAGIPNLGGTVEQAVRLIERRSQDSAVLREWWTSPAAAQFKELAQQVRNLSPMIGDEVVLAAVRRENKRLSPLLVTEVKAGQEQALAAALEAFAPAAYQITGGLLVLANSKSELFAHLPALGHGAQSEFAVEIGRHYPRGVSWLLAADASALHPPAALAQARYLFLEQHSGPQGEENEASLTFAGPRTGIASLLASPAASASAEYVSSDAVLALSAATRSPVQMLAELSGTLGRKFSDTLRELDIEGAAGAVGTDFTVAVESFNIPIPNWVAAIEVYQPEALNAALHAAIDAQNRKLATGSKLVWLDETVNGRAWTSVSFSGSPIVLHWTFDRGFLVLSTDRGNVTRAIATRSSGFPLIRSSRFRELLPTSAALHLSGFAWIHMNGALDGAAALVNSDDFKKLLALREPALFTFQGETERIQVASRTQLTSFMMDMMVTQSPQK